MGCNERHAWLALCLGALFTCVALAQTSNVQTYALLIGINNYRPYPETPGMPPLNYAESDARRMAQVLRDPSRSPVNKVRILLDTDATKTAIEAELRDLAKRMQLGDTLLVYYSGHGMPTSSGQASMMPADAKTNDEETWLPLETIQALVKRHSQNRGRLILIVDACFSGRSQPGSRSFAIEGRRDNPQVVSPTQAGSDVILASSADTQPSWEDQELEGGVFTAYLLEAMRGAADFDGDGLVTVQEAFQYLSTKVEEFSTRKGNQQTPKLYGPGDFLLTLNPTVVAKNRLAKLKISNLINGDQFDILAGLVDAQRQPEDILFYLNGYLTNSQFIFLVNTGAVPGVPAGQKADPRLLKLGSLRQKVKIRLEQFWILSNMVQTGKAERDLSDYLAGRLSETKFLQRLKSGAIRGVPR